MLKAKALSLKNKDRDIFESKHPFKNKNKFEATVAKRAKELVKIKKDKDAAKKAEELEKIIKDNENVKKNSIKKELPSIGVEIKNIVNEWDTVSIIYLLEQTKIGETMSQMIEKLVKKNTYVFPPELFYFADAKKLLEELIKQYTIAKINEVILEYINHVDEDAKQPLNKDYYPLYQKRLSNITVRNINNGKSALQKTQRKELELPSADVEINKNVEAPKQEENIQIISSKLQHLLFIKGIDKTKKALIKLKYNGRLHTNPMLRTAQIVQNFNTIPKMKQLIKELESDI